MVSSKSSTAPAVAWPTLSPSGTPLALVTLFPDLYSLPAVFSPALLTSFAAFLPSLPMAPSQIKRQRGEASRTNDRFQVDDRDFAKRLWERTGLREVCGGLKSKRKGGASAVGLNSNIRIYRYREGAYFGPHYDDDTVDSLTGLRSEFTLLIYLTGIEDGVVGGETAFYPHGLPSPKSKNKGIVVPLQRGAAVIHRHGADCMVHEGLVVEKGEKWVLRSDVMFA